jgi:hypothetical protein
MYTTMPGFLSFFFLEFELKTSCLLYYMSHIASPHAWLSNSVYAGTLNSTWKQ